ncbi:hypothetical protein AB0P21_12710 [Kribbella sp. NPDC056861]|uniref:hypothetical protein n=1 Tax=Kribbella sp. NPDC056861 TaxID=3154857 RepID=UPI003438380A
MTVRRKPLAGRLLLAGFLAVVIGLIGAAFTGSSGDLSYEVRTAEPLADGKVPACRSTALFVNSRTGAELPCFGTPVGGFTAADRQQILRLATELAADGGIDAGEEFKLTELAADIGHQHDDASSQAGPIAFGVLAVLGALALAAGIALRTAAAIRRSSRRR